MNDPSPYSAATGVALPRAQSRLEAVMPPRAVKPRFLELTAKPTRYTLTGLRPGGPKTLPDGTKLDVLVVAAFKDAAGVAHEWELTAKGAYAQLRAILEQLDERTLDGIIDGAGSLELELAVQGKGTGTTYTVRRASP